MEYLKYPMFERNDRFLSFLMYYVLQMNNDVFHIHYVLMFGEPFGYGINTSDFITNALSAMSRGPFTNTDWLKFGQGLLIKSIVLYGM